MREIVKDSVDQSVVIRIIDSTSGLPEQAVEHDSGGIAMWYRREGGTKQTVATAALAALDTAHADGGIEHIDDGYYRFDLPDAAVATGVNGVMVGGAVTDMIVMGTYTPLIDFNKYGTPDVNATQISGSAAAANNVESVFLGTGHTDDVDLSARKLLLNSDTDVALEILSSDDSAIKAVSTASGKHGLELAGNVAGHGLQTTGGTTGDGIKALGGATSGSGIKAEAATEGDGIHAIGKGTDEHGIYAVGGDTTGSGIKAEAATSGDGILAVGATNGHGLNVDGAGSGEGISATGGATGHGVEAIGGATSGAGIKASAQNNNDAGMELVKHGTGDDLDADDLKEITAARMGALTDWIDAGRLDAILDTIAGDVVNIDGIVPATAGDAMNLAADAIKAVSYDESTAFPVKSDDSAATQIARVGADGDTLETLSDQADLQALASVATEARLAELDAANLPADIDTLLTRIVGLIATKAQMDTAHALLATPAQVNTEVSDVIKVDTSTLTPQGALTATPTIEEMLVLLYKVIRNKTTQTATLWTLFADDGSTADQKSTVSDDATTFTKAEIVTGA